MYKKILLVQPPIRDFYCTIQRLTPIGLEYLAGAAESVGWKPKILDCLAYKRPKRHELPQSMQYMKEFYPEDDISPFSLFKKFQHFGMNYDNIKEEIKSFMPDVVGVSSLFTPYQYEALKITDIVKEINPDIVTIMGGGFPTCEPQKALNYKNVDYIVTGEGEEPLKHILSVLDSGKGVGFPGVGHKENYMPHNCSVSDKIPSRSIKYLSKKILSGKQKWVALQTSRGCPNNCTFCSSKLVYSGKFRQRPVVDVVMEMRSILKVAPEAKFNFEDDNLTCNKDWVLEFCSEIKKVFGKRRLELAAMNGLSAADLCEERLNVMYEAGFSKLDLSLAVYSEQLQKETLRPFDTEKFVSIVNTAVEIGFKVTAYFILGLPGQTIESIGESIKTLASLPISISPSVYYPTPGTELFNYCVENNLLDTSKPELWRSTCIPVETNEVKRIDIVTYMRIVRMINFIKENTAQEQIHLLTRASNTVKLTGYNRQDKNVSWLISKIFNERNFFLLKKTSNDVIIQELETSKRAFDSVFDETNIRWITSVRKF